ncbi:helix-turn-helix domain-containing protein [Streptomyces sp. NBC_01092]|uniref:PucR family transcriptional regulator n=1 Tax=Streptomyces sp. NBC_01092 TaxID=2903748 RepID=UPI00386C768E|nr:helix-turn-helix domain-containing protein [Streptomyces sp. NBC_01092]
MHSRDLEQLAAAACWPLPQSVQAVVSRDIHTSIHVPDGCRLLRQVSANRVRVLVVESGSAPGRNAATTLGAAFRGSPAVVGPSVPLALAGTSLRWAEYVLTELGRNAHGVHRAVDHPAGWILANNRQVADSLAAALLEPLNRCTPLRREQLEATLLAWLQWRAAPEVARALNVHPQTVRYRMRRLHALFGHALSEPDICLALELALRSRRFRQPPQ